MLAVLRWMLLLLVLSALGLVWLPADWPQRVLAVERHWCLTALGPMTGSAVLERVEEWRAEVQAGDGRGATGATASGLGWLSGWEGRAWGVGWSADRRVLLRSLRELLILRLVLLAAWGPALLMLLAAAVLDGHWTWRIRQCGFDYPSPIGHQASTTGVGLLILVLALELGLPLPLHPVLLPLAVLLGATLIAIGLRNLPKQL